MANRAGTNPGFLDSAQNDGEGERVPLFGSWRNAYLTAVVVFVVDVAAFYAISRYFA